MSIKEVFEKIERNIDKLNFTSSYHSTQVSDLNYAAKNFISLKDAINDLSDIDFIHPQISILRSSALFNNYKDEDAFNSTNNGIISKTVEELRIGLQFLLKYYDSSIKYSEDVIEIKLPEIKSFDDFTKTSNELKKALEIPIIDSNTEGSVQILTAENGSIWIIVSVGSMAAVNLVASICWAAAVIRKKAAEAKMFEAQAKTLDLKNEILEALIEGSKNQFRNIISAEAEAIASKHYDVKDPETIARLKLSLETVADLFDRGAKILPHTKEENIRKSFPDYNNLELITSTIKQITGGNG